jgi:tetratricopeptide (TPR) repeat protein
MRDVRRAHALGVALAIAAALAGLVRDPSAPAADAKRVVALAVALLACAVTLARPAVRIEWHRGAQLALGALAVSALSALYGLPSGLLDLGSWVAGAALAVAVASLGRATAIVALRTVALCLGGGASLLALAQAARGASGMQLEGAQGNPNWLGLLLAVVLPLSLDAARVHLRARRTPLAALCAFVVLAELVALYASHSRVAWLATLIALPVVFLRRASPRGRVVAVAVAVALVAAVTGVALARHDRAAASAASAVATSKPRASHGAHASPGVHAEPELDAAHEAPLGVALEGRLAIARTSAVAGIAELPFGAGLGRFGHAYLAAQGAALASLPPREASRRFVNATTAHDDWLQLAVESGPFAPLLLLLAFVLAARAHVRARCSSAAAALVACAICALADSPLRQPAVVIVVALAFAALPQRLAVGAPGAADHVRRARAFSLSALAATALVLAPAMRGYLAARIRTEARDALPDARLALLSKSARVDPGSGEAALDLGLARLESGDAEGALVALRRSRKLLANVGTSIAIGNAELARGRADLAEPEYRAALAESPGSLRAHADLAEALRQLGKLDDAESHARTALSIAPGEARVRELVDRIHRDRMDATGDGP